MRMIKNILRRWLPLAAAIAGLAGLAYLVGQQIIRVGYGNQPQVQMAEDAAAALAGGASANSLVSDTPVDMSRSLAPFLIMYDSAGKVTASSGRLDGQTPALPSGVLDYAKSHGENRLTWSPRVPDVRIAAVVVPVNGGSQGYVLAGRSMRELEKSEDLVQLQAMTAMLVTLAVSLIVTALAEVFLPAG